MEVSGDQWKLYIVGMRLGPIAIHVEVGYHAHFKHCVSYVSKSLAMVCINSSFLL